MGWNVMPTARNARGIDIIAYDKEAKGYIGVQVKALSRRYPVPLGGGIDGIMGDYWVIVNNCRAEPCSFIMLPKEVRKLAHRGEKNGIVSYWLEPNDYDKPKFREAWHRIGY